MDFKRILNEKTSLDLQKNIRKRGGNETRSVAVRWFLSAVLVIAFFLIASLPFTSIGETVGLQEVLTKLSLIEKKMHGIRSLAEYKLPPKVDLCGKAVPINRQHVKEALEREFYINLARRTGAILWIKMSAKYFPHIESRLKERGMPDDLKYLAVAESDLNIYAKSPASAVGLWQFIPGTGRSYGLKVDGYFDERRDFFRSTEAALDFLQSLYETYNDWHLAMAAYNAGPGRVSSELKNQKADNYFDLNLPIETERYIYRIASIKIIMANPKAYGLNIPTNELYPQLKFDTAIFTVPVKNMYLGVISDSLGMTFKELREFNPAMESDYLPLGTCRLNLPPGTADKFLESWKQIKESKNLKTGPTPQGGSKRKVHVVRSGETLNSIAHRYGVNVSDICRWNKINQKSILHAGKKLIIY